VDTIGAHMQDCGIIYVASISDGYVEEAFLSANSVKRRHPELSITLFTDRTWHALCSSAVFDLVRDIPEEAKGGAPWTRGKLNRSACLSLTPYSRTLHLDTDTRVIVEDLTPLFERLSNIEIAMAEASVDDSYSRRHYGRRLFNSGVILFKKTPSVLSLLKDWSFTSRCNFQLAAESVDCDVPILRHVSDRDVRRKLLYFDQVALVNLFSPDHNPLGLLADILEPSWNHRGSRLLENNSAPINILHSPALRDLRYADLLSVAFDWKSVGRTGEASLLKSYVELVYATRRLGSPPSS
jgi:hypothetical protein